MKPPLPQPITLSAGETAVFEEDRFHPGTFQLLVNDTPQSHIDPHHPEELLFDYVRRIGYVLDHVAPAGTPITAVHLGGGAFTLPRYVEATRRGSRQQVVELSGELVDYVREHFPLPKHASIRVRRGDARATAEKFPAGLKGNVDAVVVDVFSGAQTPAHLTSVEFYEALRPLLRPNGVVIVNTTDGAGMQFVKAQLATLGEVFDRVAAIGEPQVLRGRRFGNVILLARLGTESWDWLPRVVTQGPFPARLLADDELRRFIAGARAVTDATAKPSPLPPENIFDLKS